MQNVTGNLTVQSNITLQNVTGNLTTGVPNATAGTLNTTGASNRTLGSTANRTQSRAAPPAARTPSSTAKKDAPCGNGNLDAGENCFTCPKDVKCKPGAMCTEEGLCVSQGNVWLYVGIGFGIMGLVAVFLFARRMAKRSAEPEHVSAQPIVQPAEQVPQPGQLVQAAPTIGNAATLMGAPSEMQANVQKEEPKEEIPEVHMPGVNAGETGIQAFIRQRKEKGWNDEQIRQKMKEAGWSETQIAIEFLKLPKFVRKQ